MIRITCSILSICSALTPAMSTAAEHRSTSAPPGADVIYVDATRRPTLVKKHTSQHNVLFQAHIYRITVPKSLPISPKAWPEFIWLTAAGAKETPSLFGASTLRRLAQAIAIMMAAATVANYIGDVPFFIDLKLFDLERLEVLLGPQGTLFGAGTLAGAIRYIPARPQFGGVNTRLRAEFSDGAQSAALSAHGGATLNLPLSNQLAFRGSFDWVSNSGFIDYVNLVDVPGQTNPDSADGLRHEKDLDGEDTRTARLALRWMPTDQVDLNLSYTRQHENIEGRRTSHYLSGVPRFLSGSDRVGRYENAARVREPNAIDKSLLAFETNTEFSLGRLTTATGYSIARGAGQRDQTDLLLSLGAGFELFPALSAFSNDEAEEKRLTQEVRFVSNLSGPVQFIVGGFFNRARTYARSAEFTPGLPEFSSIILPTGDLEYFAVTNSKLTEQAIFGELSYKLSNALSLSVGARYFDYALESFQTAALPFSGFDGGLPALPLTLDQVEALDFNPDLGFGEDGAVFAASLSYAINPAHFIYASYREGYRIGGRNPLPPCPDNAGAVPTICALSLGQPFVFSGLPITSPRNEQSFGADTTKNYELGYRGSFVGGRLALEAIGFYIDWDDPQVQSASANGAAPILINAGGARSYGAQVRATANPTERIKLRANLGLTRARLSSNVSALIKTITPPGFAPTFEDGIDGDRLPGSPEVTFFVGGSYRYPLDGGRALVMRSTFDYQGDVLTRTGGRGDSFTLPEYGVANLSLSYETPNWQASLFVNNLTNRFAQTGAIKTPLHAQSVQDIFGGTHYSRSFAVHVLAPREIGLRFRHQFGG